MMVTTNVLAIGYRLITDQNRVLIMNNYVRLDDYTDKIMEQQYSWLYFHKSQYALILVLCIAFCVVYRKLFRNIYTYLLSLGVLLFALYLSDTYTSMAAVILIFIGQFFDYLCKAKWWKKLIALTMLGIPGIIGCIKLYEMIIKNRDLLTLGGRTLIWKGSWEMITNHPNGISNYSMGVNQFIYFIRSDGWKCWTYNCHNVFLNQMFRYSFPVGSIYVLLFLIIFLFAVIRDFSFSKIFIFLSILIPLSMDYSLTNTELLLYLTLIFVLFYKNNKVKK